MTHFEEKAENMPELTGAKRVYFGTHKELGPMVLNRPQWDRERSQAWSFGYLSGKDRHITLCELRTTKYLAPADLYREFSDLNSNFATGATIWTFCELVNTVLGLEKTVKLLNGGSAYLRVNPLAEVIQNTDEVKRIQTVVLPAIFSEISELLKL